MTYDYKKERENDLNNILSSQHAKNVVVAGPGTGKSHLFKKFIKQQKKRHDKESFLAITFIGKLTDELADDLAGLAETTTLHALARKIVINSVPDWNYLPGIKYIIEKDLEIKGVNSWQIGDNNYRSRALFYKAFGDDDVVHYAKKILNKDRNKIPKYDLILVDEFQDFNDDEAEFVDLLASENEILIVGDDDQVLYLFRGSSPKHIRNKYEPSNTEYQKHSLRFSSRCTEVIIEAFHNLIGAYKGAFDIDGHIRIEKDYICYLPDKEEDNEKNQNIHVIKDIPPTAIPKKILSELAEMLNDQSIKSVLVIGEAQTCKKSILPTVKSGLEELGFANVNINSDKEFCSFKTNIYEGYKLLSEDNNSALGWRILMGDDMDDFVFKYYDKAENFVSNIPEDFIKQHMRNINTFNRLITKTPYSRKQIAESSINKLREIILDNQLSQNDVFIDEVVRKSKFLPRPLRNLKITVTTTLGCKGLGADVVFLVGFDQGKLPNNKSPDINEIYQMLVALTRAKKRIYLMNTKDKQISMFIDDLDKNILQVEKWSK